MYHKCGWLIATEPPHEDTISKAMCQPGMYDRYVELIELIGNLFVNSERTFLIDGQFYRTPCALFDVKVKDPNDRKKTITRRAQFIKLVVVLCAESKAVAALSIINEEEGENSRHLELFKRTRLRFHLMELACADTLYSDAIFRKWLDDNGIKRRIPFRDNAVPNGDGSTWDRDLDEFHEALEADDEWWVDYLIRLTVESYFAALMRSNGNTKKLRNKTFESLKVELSSIVLNYQLRMAFIAYLRGTIDIPWLSPRTREVMDRLRKAYLSASSARPEVSQAS